MRRAGLSILGFALLTLTWARRCNWKGGDQVPQGQPALPGGAAGSLNAYLKSASTLRETAHQATRRPGALSYRTRIDLAALQLPLKR
jgi:hypothetical protein